MRFWQRDRELRRLEAELRAARHEAPRDFIRTLIAGEREPRWLRPRLRIGAAVALAALALAAMASAGGMGVIKQGTKAAVHVIKRTTHASAPRRVLASPAGNQYQPHCNGVGLPQCQVTIYDASVREGDSGLTQITFTVALSAYPDTPVLVQWNTENRTATGGACVPNAPDGNPDYVSGAGTLLFNIGETSKTITIDVCGDTFPEPNETFVVRITSTDAEVVRSPATGTILNDDK
jgi:hypothetical protein